MLLNFEPSRSNNIRDIEYKNFHDLVKFIPRATFSSTSTLEVFKIKMSARFHFTSNITLFASA